MALGGDIFNRQGRLLVPFLIRSSYPREKYEFKSLVIEKSSKKKKLILIVGVLPIKSCFEVENKLNEVFKMFVGYCFRIKRLKNRFLSPKTLNSNFLAASSD